MEANKKMPESESTQTPDTSTEEAQAATPEAIAELGQSEVERLSEEVAKLRDQWARAAAEADNIRKRAQREIEDASKYAVSGFARDMVSVLENLKRASESIPVAQRTQNELLKTLGEGVDLTLNELLAVFDRYHIKRIYPLEQKFDHNLHQAVVQVERDDVEAGMVVQVVQAGYMLHDRLLRPAMVAVSKKPESPKNLDTTA
ncbi:MAG: nucleotide exchange factor GrpE [Rickettsiales bacterium]|nr:nucleotide exchange factor GrpE [Rickettsiales bacterium]